MADAKQPTDFDIKQLTLGWFVEREHSDDKFKRLEIAMDHLEENQIYYTDLIKSGIVDEQEAINLFNTWFPEDSVEENETQSLMEMFKKRANIL